MHSSHWRRRQGDEPQQRLRGAWQSSISRHHSLRCRTQGLCYVVLCCIGLMGNGIQKRSHSLSHWYFWLGSTIPSIRAYHFCSSGVRCPQFSPILPLGFRCSQESSFSLSGARVREQVCVCVCVRVCVCARVCVRRLKIETRHSDSDSWYEELPRRHKKNLTVDMKCYLLQLHASDVTKQQQPDSWYEVLPLSLQLHASDVTKTTWQLIWSDASLCPFSYLPLTSLKKSWQLIWSVAPVPSAACFWRHWNLPDVSSIPAVLSVPKLILRLAFGKMR